MAVIQNFGVPTKDASATTLMPKLQYRFRVTFSLLGDKTSKDIVTQNVVSVGRPSVTHEEVIVDSYNSKMYLAGKHTWEPISIVLRDDMNSAVVKALGNQLNKQLDHNSQSSAVAGSVYKFDMAIETLDGNNGEGNTPVVFDKWEIEGAFLSGVQYGDLNYSTSDMVQVTATIRYDNAKHVIVNGAKDADTLSGEVRGTGTGVTPSV